MTNKRHADAKKELVTLLKTASVNGIAITTDGWTSSATQSYVTYTVHCITQEWTLLSAVLETSIFHRSHTSQHLVEHFVKMIKSFNMPYPEVTAVTHDETANMVAAGRMFVQ